MFNVKNIIKSQLSGFMGAGVSLSLPRNGFPVVILFEVSVPSSREQGCYGRLNLPDLDVAVENINDKVRPKMGQFRVGIGMVDTRSGHRSSYPTFPKPDLHIYGDRPISSTLGFRFRAKCRSQERDLRRVAISDEAGIGAVSVDQRFSTYGSTVLWKSTTDLEHGVAVSVDAGDGRSQLPIYRSTVCAGVGNGVVRFDDGEGAVSADYIGLATDYIAAACIDESRVGVRLLMLIIPPLRSPRPDLVSTKSSFGLMYDMDASSDPEQLVSHCNAWVRAMVPLSHSVSSSDQISICNASATNTAWRDGVQPDYGVAVPNTSDALSFGSMGSGCAIQARSEVGGHALPQKLISFPGGPVYVDYSGVVGPDYCLDFHQPAGKPGHGVDEVCKHLLVYYQCPTWADKGDLFGAKFL